MLKAVLFSVAGIAVAAAATEPPERVVRKAWELTDKERLVMRLDPVARAKRVADEDLRQGRSPVPDKLDTITGSTNPELFLPWELLDTLASEAERVMQRQRPTTTADQIQNAGLDPDTFWPDVHRLCSPYKALQAKSNELLDAMQHAGRTEHAQLAAEWEAMRGRICRERLNALAAARAHFGAEKFDRLLYGVIAPRGTIAIFFASPGKYDENLRFLAGGCR